ncbi:host RNA polymerase inhibitor [Shigella phage SFP20]|uniref:Host RNA polymerase inhibitor n=1 Tax=Shigella phage SFP20 TaxID=3017289 RepID=A0AAE9VZM5_9CAUD|nr:host RNA polymerase inhibitor [Shigella phage SFP20]
MVHYCPVCEEFGDNCTCHDQKQPIPAKPEAIYTGGSSSYYTVQVKNTTTPYGLPYTAECNDIIEALGMNFAEGNAFKALWRRAAQRTLGLRKAGAKDDGLYDAEKVEFFGARLVAQSKALNHESK